MRACWSKRTVCNPCTIFLAACFVFCAPTKTFADTAPGSKSIPTDTCELVTGARVSVTQVENSETVRLADGRRVRLLGILGPRAPLSSTQLNRTAAPAWPSETAAQDALRILVEGHEVTLAFDQRRRDRYGQMLAHLFVWHNGSRLWVQGELLAHGHARASVLPGNTACLNELLAHERLAQKPARGIWRQNFYRILKPEPARWLVAKRRHRFVVIEGRVANVAVRKSKIYLNFGRNWRNDFTAALTKQRVQNANRSLADLIALKGKRVRVRGWIERRNGPYMKLAHPNLIEQIEDPKPENPPIQENPFAPKVAGQDEAALPHWQRKQRLKIPRLKHGQKKSPQTSRSADELKL